MFGIAGTAELSTFCPGTGTWNRLQDGMFGQPAAKKRKRGKEKRDVCCGRSEKARCGNGDTFCISLSKALPCVVCC